MELPAAVEKLILQVQRRHAQIINNSARRWLHEAGEETAVQVLTEVEHVQFDTIRNLCGFVVNKVKNSRSPATPSRAFRECSPAPRPAISDGVLDDALLKLDIEKKIQAMRREACQGYGESSMPPVSSQGSNESVECGTPALSQLPCYISPRTPKPEPCSEYLSTPPSSSSDRSSQKKRSIVADDGQSSGCRKVKAKHDDVDDGQQPKMFEFYNQVRVPVLIRPTLSGSVFADALKLDFGVEPIHPLGSHTEFINPKCEDGVHPKECVFRFKECALQRSEFTTDPVWIRAFGELSFTKRFLILDHCKEPLEYPPVKELKVFKTMDVEEVDNRLFHRSNRASQIAMRDWSKLKEGYLVFTCNVRHSGKCEFSGPRFENGGTPLQRAFGEENVLRVNFEDTAHTHCMILDRYRCLGIHGIHCGLKKFVFYAYKDADAKKKQGVSKKSTYGCRSVFLAIDSDASADTENVFTRFRSIAAARSYIMHPTVPSFAKAISRLQLALSQTTQIPLDFDEVHVEYIDDIPCLDENGNVVKDSNNKTLIHTDGCGYISKNLASLIQDVVIKGIKRPEKGDPKDKQEYPLMMQVRGFHQGNLWKGVHVVNLKLPDNVIQVRRSMLKVERNDMLPSTSFNSLELCNTSRRPADARLFQHLILLLKLGGVKDEVFLQYVEAALDTLRKYFTNPEEALNVVVKNVDTHTHGELACEMLLVGLKPGKEPFLQKILAEMVKSKLQSYALGKVPVPNSTYLMGCADPTGLLERNQVAILFGNGTRICREKVLVYKPPGLHPGDVHIFEATWNKEIEAVVGAGTYGIMFSTMGARSITDEMAGSDLDGDQYWVSWNHELVDSFTPSDPWEAPLVKDEEPLPRPTDEDEFERLHFNKFIQARFDPSKIKGASANAWLSLTDCTMSCNVNEIEKIRAKRFIPVVVNLFYDSLDADKAGKEVKWVKELHCNIFPHFLEKNKEEAIYDSNKQRWNGSSSKKLPAKIYNEYNSTSILGRIYNMVKKEDFDKLLEVVSDETFEYEGYMYYYQYWSDKFSEYKKAMRIELQKPDEQGSKSCGSESIIAHYKKIFLGEGKSEEQLLKEASAIYAVVYTDSMKKELHHQTLQFAWKVAGSELCIIYARKTRGTGGRYLCLARENLNFFLKR